MYVASVLTISDVYCKCVHLNVTNVDWVLLMLQWDPPVQLPVAAARALPSRPRWSPRGVGRRRRRLGGAGLVWAQKMGVQARASVRTSLAIPT
jgi:hypothetical protein